MKLNTHDVTKLFELEFVRATENAALHCMQWVGRGNKEAADQAASDAIREVFDKVNISGEVIIGEGVKDNAPGIFLGDHLGRWGDGDPRFEIALDPIDGTTNVSKGMLNSISVMAGAFVPQGNKSSMMNIPSFYVEKLSYGTHVAQSICNGAIAPITLNDPLEYTLEQVAKALAKPIEKLVVTVLDRPRNQIYMDAVRKMGSSLRLISDGDITAALAPSLYNSGIDLYVGIGGSPEGILTAAALKAFGGDILLRMSPQNHEERTKLLKIFSSSELAKIYSKDHLIHGESALFCATGISDSSILPGVQLVDKTVITHSILIRSRSNSIRYIKTIHEL